MIAVSLLIFYRILWCRGWLMVVWKQLQGKNNSGEETQDWDIKNKWKGAGWAWVGWHYGHMKTK